MLRSERAASAGHAGHLSRRSVALLSAAAFCSAATARVGDPLVPQVAAEFARTAGDAGLIVTAFTFAYGLCQLLYGPLGDRFGKYRLVAIMTVLSALTVGACAGADSLAALSLRRLLGGATVAALIPLSMAFIGDHVAFEDRQWVLARFLSGQILGVIAGQVLGGIAGDLVGWRMVFLLLGGSYLLVGLLLWHELRGPRLPPPVLRASQGPGALLAGYVGLLRRPWPRTVILVVFVEGFLFYGSLVYVGAFLRSGYALDYSFVGLSLGAFGLGGLLYAIIARRLVPRLGDHGLARGGGWLIGIGLVALPLAPTPLLAPVLIGMLGLGFYMLHNTLQTHATQMAPEARGLAVSAFAMALFIGQAVGVWIAGRIVDQAGYAALFLATGPGTLALALVFAARLRHRASLARAGAAQV
jgi:predicted MFS family arabinose efflux permease